MSSSPLKAPVRLVPLLLLAVGTSTSVQGQEYSLHSFERLHLSDVYYSEGAAVGDLDGDGVVDVTSGPLWFKGPDFELGGELRPPVAQNKDGYTDHFFSWTHDFDGDGRLDVFSVGFPGTPAYVYVNPGPDGLDKHWPRHQVFDKVSNESPHLTQLVGTPEPELICTRDGFFGYATIDPAAPLSTWAFHPISEQVAHRTFGHGLGVGDVDGDGRLDMIARKGWYQQPADLSGDPLWPFHPVRFAEPGGAEMYAYDVDGDGDNDVITTLSAHEFGLSWFEQVQKEGVITFEEHLIMGSKPEQNPYGLHFSELHSLVLADMDGDGLKDIVTGKTYYSHHQGSTDWDAGAVVYWFRLVRRSKADGGGVEWVPQFVDGDAGIGRQIVVTDVNADGQLDIVVGGMKGLSVLVHKVTPADAAGWRAAQPKRRTDG